MLIKKYNSIMQMSEGDRNKWAFGLSVTCSMVILAGFVFYKGFLSFGGGSTVANNKFVAQTASVVSASLAPSPLESSKKTVDGLLGDIVDQYDAFKASIESVLVPFVTGIDVYDSKQ